MRGILRHLALGVAGVLLLASCASLPAPAPGASGGALTAVAAPTVRSPAEAVVSDAAPTGATARPVSPKPTSAAEPTIAPAPGFSCTPGQLTPAQTEGPYYKANPPETASLMQPNMGGTRLTITGHVLDAECQPVPGARVDFWQADSEGRYDNQGYTLRGYQLTDAQGRYSVETIVPGLYPGRTRHIHVKVTAPGGPTLTTQLYFPDEPANASDGIYSPRMVLTIEKTNTGEVGRFDFVIATR